MRRLLAFLVAALIALVLIGDSLFVLGEHETAAIERLNVPIRAINATGETPGLHWKAPLIDRVVRADRRPQLFVAEDVPVKTRDGAALDITPVLVFRVTDPLRLARAYRSAETRKSGLQMIAREAALGAGRSLTADSLTRDRAAAGAEALAAARRAMRGHPTGLALDAVLIQRIDMTAADQARTYLTMKDVNRAAARTAAASLEAREAVTEAQTVAEEEAILAPARAQAAEIRAETARQRAAILDPAYDRDPRLAAFYRQMRAYETSLADGKTTLILSPDSPFLKYLRGPKPAAPAK